MGGREFAAMLNESPSDRDFIRTIAGVPVVPDQWQFEKLALVKPSNRVLFYVPGSPHGYHAPVCGKIYPDAAQSVGSIVHALPRDSRIALMPEGPFVLARAAMNGSTPRTGPDLMPRRGAAQLARSE